VTPRSRLANANLRNEANKLFVFSRAWNARANFEQLLLVLSDEYFAPGLSEGVQAYKKEGPKFMQRLVAKQKTRVGLYKRIVMREVEPLSYDPRLLRKQRRLQR
jgi:hypothetical protein